MTTNANMLVKKINFELKEGSKNRSCSHCYYSNAAYCFLLSSNVEKKQLLLINFKVLKNC